MPSGTAGRAILLLLVALTVGVPLAIPAPASAAPSAAELEKQIDLAWQKLEPIIEKHNATRADLATKRKRAGDLGKRIAPLQLHVDLALARVAQFAAQAYKSGDAANVNALLNSGASTSFAGRLTLLDHFARAEQARIANFVELKRAYDAQKAPLDALIVTLTNTERELGTKEAEINAEIKRLQVLRLQAYGTSGGLGALRPAPCPFSYPGGAAGIAVKFACSQIGKPYGWGDEGPGSYDCSGLTMASWARAGVSLPHNAARQRRAVPSVSQKNLRPGDLAFYYADLHHVAIYVGGGWMVHASRPGEPIRMRRLNHSPIHSFGRPG